MERMQSTWEHVVEHDLSESGVAPLSSEELFADDPAALRAALAVPLGYAQGNGDRALREEIASFYPGADPDGVCVTTGTSEANFLAVLTLVEPGDRVAVVMPSYMQVHGWARGLGAEVVPVWLEEARGWRFDHGALRRAARSAKLVYVCEPNNPTGAVMTDDDRAALQDTIDESGAWLLADQVYRGAERVGPLTPSLLGDQVVITSGLSKAFGLPGLRVGWILSTPEVANRIWANHDYTTIAPTTLSATFARHALRQRERILARTRAILRQNWPVVEEWAGEHGLRGVAPSAGAIAFLRADLPVPASAFVDRLIRERGTMVVPGDHFLMDGYGEAAHEVREPRGRGDVAGRQPRLETYLRIGFGIGRERLEAGLARVGELLESVCASPS